MLEEGDPICRLCLGRHATRTYAIDAHIVDKIRSFCALTIFENDGLPGHVCDACLGTLDLFVSFRSQCEESDRLLREGLLDVKHDVKQEDISPPNSVCYDEVKEEADEKKPRRTPRGKRRKRRWGAPDRGGLCPFCGKVFHRLASLNRHVQMHTMERTHSCSKCAKSFKEPRKLKEHERTHDDVKDSPCMDCGKLFRDKYAVKKHHEAVHMKSKVVACELCNKKLSSRGSLKCHMKSHTGEKEFICDTCNQGFGFKSSLIIHMRVHTGEKPYLCKYCDSRFAAMKTHREHERLHTGETPYLCPVCSKGFSQKSNMKSHFRNNHKDVDYVF